LIDLQRALEKGEGPEEERRAVESDVTDKVLLVYWRGTRVQLIWVLYRVREVIPGEPDASHGADQFGKGT